MEKATSIYSLEMKVSIASLVIAIFSIWLTINSNEQMKKHNRLSVIPHITLTEYIDEENYEYKIILNNHGLGPAIINNFDFLIDEKKFNYTFEIDSFKEELIKNNIISKYMELEQLNIIYPNNGIAINEKQIIASFKLNYLSYKLNNEVIEFNDFLKNIKRLNIRIKYSSFYKEEVLISGLNR